MITLPTTRETLAEFLTNWQLWWNGLQPEGRFTDGLLDVSVEGYEFTDMAVPGKNGFLNVIARLHAWGSSVAAGMANKSDWLKAVEDVTAVLRVLPRGDLQETASAAAEPEVPRSRKRKDPAASTTARGRKSTSTAPAK